MGSEGDISPYKDYIQQRDLMKKATRLVQASPKPILWRLMVPLASVLSLLIIGFTTGISIQHNRQSEEASQWILKDAINELSGILDEQSRALAAVETALVQETELKGLLKFQDRQRLLDIYAPVFTKLKNDYALTHFYFIDIHRICLLRVHKPEKYGDFIDRFTAQEAERTGKIASGIEIGPLGTFTLRVVQPVFDGETLIGYLELGKEIEDVLARIHRHTRIELAVTLKKSALNQESWEAGMKMLGREVDWERFPKEVLIYSTLSPFPVEAGPFIDGHLHLYGEATVEARFNDATWRIMASPLQEVSGVEVGDLIVMHDGSALKAANQKFMIFSVGSAIGLLSILFSFLFNLLRRTDSGIQTQQTERKQAEGNLSESEKKYRLLFETIIHGIQEIDISGEIISANSACHMMLGYKKGELKGRSMFEFIANSNQRKTLHDNIQILIQQQSKPRTWFGKIKKKNGDVFDGQTDWNYKRNMHGEVISFIFVISDITERKKIEKERKKLIDELSELNKGLKKAMFVSSQATADAEIKNYQLEIEIDQRILSENINKSLIEISNAINITSDLGALYKTIHKSLMKILDVTNFFIATYNKEEDLIFFPYVSDKKISEFVAIKNISKQKESLIGKVIFSRKPVFLKKGEQINSDSIANPGQKSGHLIHAWLGVPLENKGEVVGVMATQSFTDQNYYSKKARDIFISVAKQVALAIEVKRSNDALLESEKKHKKLAYQDTLTGLPNRKAFYDQFEKYCDRANRNDEKVVLFFLDIDKFKKVNDTLGHGVGDALLVEISNRLKKSLRKIDFIARMGGDEFTIIVDNHKNFQPEKVAKKIIEILSETYHLKNKTIDYVSSSIGISFYPDDSTELSQLVIMADQAMYKAKEQGNRYQFYSD